MSKLPPVTTRRWGIKKKVAVIEAVKSGFISKSEVLLRYGLSEEEYNSWLAMFDKFGELGLRVTLSQIYRRELSFSSNA